MIHIDDGLKVREWAKGMKNFISSLGIKKFNILVSQWWCGQKNPHTLILNELKPTHNFLQDILNILFIFISLKMSKTISNNLHTSPNPLLI